MFDVRAYYILGSAFEVLIQKLKFKVTLGDLLSSAFVKDMLNKLFTASPEHNILMVSFCNFLFSVVSVWVQPLTFFLNDISS